ncbi:hypothetical protein Gotri_007917 [Gossypium trilobum]|uniref:Uncharacterized protein n=1 Tax=Gossypium trilobum TaxID=34281 RepID=A0A7J9EHQ6_9ROSI|nr:hypothetical protein [Gossypium trilobum]
MWGVNHHFGRRTVRVRVTGRGVCTHRTFPMLGDDSTEVQRVRYARVYILQILRGYLMLDKSRNLVHLRSYLSNYATVEMHQTHRMLRQFRFRQLISMAPEDPWQAIFTLERGEASINLCRKITWPFKYKDKGWRGEPINSAYAITDPNRASNDGYTTAPSDYVKCLS